MLCWINFETMKGTAIFLVICFLFPWLTHCSDNTSHKTTTLYHNATSHRITIRGYKDGAARSEADIVITPGTSQIADIDRGEGKGLGLVFPFSIPDVDSLRVEFDSNRTALHCGIFLVSGTNPNALPYDNERNMLNLDNWEWIKKRETRRYLESELIFTITEEDYINAK